LPRFPKVEQDICLKVAADLPFHELESFVVRQIMAAKPQNSYVTTSTLDIYRRADDKEHKQITFRVSIASYERTLTDPEITTMLDRVAAAAKEKLNAERV
jgi:phenylalanyl-tRNA synthetase beta subunit